MKAKNKKRIQGSISIFLVIIMMPVLWVVGLIVDASRLEVAKESVSSAGELTMNSALANYDTVLKDVYGLFAMSQSQTDEEFQNDLYEYFADTLIANKSTNNKTSETDSVTKGDFLKMDVDKNNFKATKNKESSLANPQILKNQIVEYMKYRAPINAALSLLDGLKILKKVTDQKKVMEAKNSVDEKAEDLSGKLKKLYEQLCEYNEKEVILKKTFNIKASGPIEPDIFETGGISANIGSSITYKEAYDKIIPAYIRTLYLQERFKQPMSSEDAEKFHPKSKEEALSKLKESLDSNTMTEFANKLSSVTAEKIDNMVFLNNKGTDLEAYADQYEMCMKKADEVSQYFSKYEYFCVYGTNLTELIAIKQQVKAFLEPYEKIQQNVESYKGKVQDGQDIASRLMRKANENVNDKIKKIDDTVNIINDSMEKCEDIKGEIRALEERNESLNGAISKYDEKSEEEDTFSQQMKDEHKYYKEHLTVETVDSMKSRLAVIKAYLLEIKVYLESIKFNNIMIKESCMVSIHEMDKKMKTSVGVGDDINGKISSLKTKYTSIDKKPEGKNISIKEEELWIYLDKNFCSGEEDKKYKTIKEDMKKEADKKKKEGEGKDESGINNSNTITAEMQKMLPSTNAQQEQTRIVDTTNKFSKIFTDIGNSIGDIVGALVELDFAKLGRDLRDNLYTTSYIGSMFSYHTIVKETERENREKKKEAVATTLGGVEINAENNYLYGSEIEYILYGSLPPNENVKSAKGRIFAIRFIANSAYALTNAEIKSETLYVALAIKAATFGLVPVKAAQVVLQLSLALAETSVDMTLLEKGEKVAFIKSYDTWKLSLQGGVEKAFEMIQSGTENIINTAKESVKKHTNDLIDAGSEKIKVNVDEYIDEIRVSIQEEVFKLTGYVFSAFEETIVTELDRKLTDVKGEIKDAGAEAKAIIEEADKKALDIIASQADDRVKGIMQDFYNEHISNIKSEMEGKIEDILSNIEDRTIMKKVTEVQQELTNNISKILKDITFSVKDKVNGIVDDFSSQLKDVKDGVIDMASDKILDITDTFFDSTFKSISNKLPGGSGKKKLARECLLKFSYKDYIQMFLFLKLCVSNEETIKRTADVIQLNVNMGLNRYEYTHPQKGNFQMSKAYTYVEIDAPVKMKTIFLSSDGIKSSTDTKEYGFTIDYKSVLGY